MRKKILEKRLARLKAKKTSLQERALASQDVAEVRSINDEIEDINAEIDECQDELDAIAEEERSATPVPAGTPVPATAELRGVASFAQNLEKRDDSDPYATLEYREAFKAFVQRGIPISEELTKRAGGDPGVTIAEDLGLIIPTTIMNEFLKEVSKVYGQVYGKVRKLNIKGGVKFPISKLKAKFSWITETTVSDKQKAGEIKEYIEFSYNIGEIRVASTLLAQVVSLALFEQEIVRIMLEAYVETMDKVIINGTGEGQPLGITKDPRVTNVVEFTAAEFADWKAWRKNLFAKIPLSKRGKGEFLFTAATVEANLLTMNDGNNRPIFKEATSLSVGESATSGSFYGRSVTLVEPDVIADFDTAASGDIVGIYWVPTDYAINTQLQFGMKRYFDEDTNEWINKGLTIVDGKMIDTSGCYLIKKK